MFSPSIFILIQYIFSESLICIFQRKTTSQKLMGKKLNKFRKFLLFISNASQTNINLNWISIYRIYCTLV